jgi:hypothetical protein
MMMNQTIPSGQLAYYISTIHAPLDRSLRPALETGSLICNIPLTLLLLHCRLMLQARIPFPLIFQKFHSNANIGNPDMLAF